MFVVCSVLLILMGLGMVVCPLVIRCRMAGEEAPSQVLAGGRQAIASIVGLLLMSAGVLLLLPVLTGRIVLPLH